MTLITAIMLMIYKRKNGLGYSEAKFLFKTEMNDYILVLGVFLSGGDMSRFKYRYKIKNGSISVSYKPFKR